MKTIALTARRVTLPERVESPFRLPRKRSLKVEISTARAFITEAERREPKFVKFGLPPTFISEFKALVDEMQMAVDTRLSSKTVKGLAQAGIRTELGRGFFAIRDLDAVVAIATREDPIRFAAWRSARRIEGQGSSSASAPKVVLPVPVVAPPASSSIEPPVTVEPVMVVTPASPPAAPTPPMGEAAIREHEAPTLQRAS